MIPIVLCIDVEPDAREPEPGAPVAWDGWAETLSTFAALRTRLSALTGRPVHFNWFLRCDLQIAILHGDAAHALHRDAAILRSLAAEGDVVGIHPHWYHLNDAKDAWLLDYGDARRIERAVRESCAVFRDTFGHPPECFRAGDAWMSNAAMALLPALGVRYDLSLEPGRTPASWRGVLPAAKGPFPALETMPRHPYRPARGDYRRPGRWIARPLWVIPVSTRLVLGAGPEPEFVAMNLVLPWAEGDLEGLLAERAAPFLVAAMRAGDLASPAWRRGLADNLERLLAQPRARDFAFVTPAALVDWYRAQTAHPRPGGTGEVRPV